MVSSTAGLTALVLAYVASFITEANSQRGGLDGDYVYDVGVQEGYRPSARGDERSSLFEDYLQKEQAVKEFLNYVMHTKSQAEKKSCFVGGGTAHFCDAQERNRAENIMKLTSGVDTPGRRR